MRRSKPEARPRSRTRRDGFTLAEMLAGFATAITVLALALRLFAALSSSTTRLGNIARDNGERWNGMRYLAELLRGATPPNDSQPFVGLQDSVFFGCQCGRSASLASERVHLYVNSDHELTVRLDTKSLPLRSAVDRLEIDYLAERGLAAKWHGRWISTASLPVALRLRLTLGREGLTPRTDTILMSVGVRL
jgi:hypothetical protein